MSEVLDGLRIADLLQCGPDRLRVLSVSINPRSTSGTVAMRGAADESLFHFKRAEPEAIAREAAELSRAAAATRAVEGIASVRLRAHDSQRGVLVTHHVPAAQSLFNYVWNGTSPWRRRHVAGADLHRVGRRLGLWLRAYHDATHCPKMEITPHVARVVSEIHDKLDLIQREYPSHLPSHTLSRVSRYANEAAAQSSAWTTPGVARVHRDMDLANVLIQANGDMYVLDFGDSREGLPWEDLARVWNALWGISRVGRRRAAPLSPCLSALLESYGETENVVSHPLFRFLRCFNAITAVSTYLVSRDYIGFTSRRASRLLARVNQAWLDSLTP
ncbi:MAG: phosphotransferase [Pirellulales bacterium]|nr:phosphotransferase [Pirellulales bacterium]